jgi:PAS domain S-box-containing protein
MADTPITIKIGVYENFPKIYTDKNNIVSGFWPDLIRHIATQENWEIEWVSGTWSQGLEKLESGEINIMPDTGWTEPRSRKYAFSNETVLVSWSRLYVANGSEIKSIIDLDKKTIAALKGSFNLDGPEGIREIVYEFNLNVIIKEMESYKQIFKALQEGKADAGVTNKDFGNQHEDDYSVKRTSIIFQPARMQFSFTKDADLTPLLIGKIDAHIIKLKRDKESVFYHALDKYIGGDREETFIEVIPEWAVLALGAGCGVIFFFLIVGVVFRLQVRGRTRELKESEERFRMLFDEAPDAIFTITMDDSIIDANVAASRMLGYRREEFQAMTLADIQAPEVRGRVGSIIRNELNMDRVFEGMDIHKDGTVVPIEIHNHKIVINGRALVLSTVRDITDRKQFEEKLRKSEEQYREYFEDDLSGAYISEPGGKLIACNQKYKTIFGFKSTQQALNIKVGELFVNLDERLEFLDRLKTNNRVTNHEPKLKNINGKSVQVVENASGVFDKEGNLEYIRGFLLDVTEQRKLETQLRQSQKMEAIGTLAGGIAHDFNNILSGIFGYAQLAEMSLEDKDKARKNIQQVVKGAQRASLLVQQILTFSRQAENKKQPLKLFLIVKEAIDFLRSSIPATIEIQEKISSKAIILADQTQAYQVVINLCTNAYHAMRDSGGILSIELDDIEITQQNHSMDNSYLPGHYVKLEIKDTGHGMDEKTLERIFDPYFTTKATDKGTGLGLAVVNGIVKNYNGFIKIYSEVGHGSIFQIFWPIVGNKSAHIVLKKKETGLPKGTEQIMLVDDEPAILETSQAILERQGYKVTTFNDSLAALKSFTENPNQFDLVITDMTMPHMAGDELSLQVLKIKKDTPIILCTGFSEVISDEKAASIGIKGFLLKPIEMKPLVQKIREVLDENKIEIAEQ